MWVAPCLVLILNCWFFRWAGTRSEKGTQRSPPCYSSSFSLLPAACFPDPLLEAWVSSLPEYRHGSAIIIWDVRSSCVCTPINGLRKLTLPLGFQMSGECAAAVGGTCPLWKADPDCQQYALLDFWRGSFCVKVVMPSAVSLGIPWN